MRETGFYESFLLLESGTDEDQVKDALAAFTEACEIKTAAVDTEITKAITIDQQKLKLEIDQKQLVRNRSVVQEILETCEKFEKEIQTQFEEWKAQDDPLYR